MLLKEIGLTLTLSVDVDVSGSERYFKRDEGVTHNLREVGWQSV